MKNVTIKSLRITFRRLIITVTMRQIEIQREQWENLGTCTVYVGADQKV